MNKLFIFLFILFLAPAVLFAQSTIIKGKVVDENNKPVSGVSIIVKGSKKGVQTDKDGNFSITVKDQVNADINFSSIGYGSVIVNSGATENLSVQLRHEAITQEDVVVIGYQTIRRKDLLASVSSVGAKDLKDIPITSAAEALNGRLAGVTATTSEGSPDATITIRVRGGISITQNNSPLYVVDGIQIENALNNISPQDIETIDVLKDAAATAIYGARGGNGVVLITTKHGKPGKLKLTYSGSVGVKFLPKKLDVLSPYDYVFYQSERARGSFADSSNFIKNFGTTWDTLANYHNVAPLDWQEEIFGNTGVTTSHSISALGGTKHVNYSFGYTYNEDKSTVINSLFKRHILNFKNDYTISRKFKAGIGINYMYADVFGAGVSDTKGSTYNRLRNAVKYRPYLSLAQDLQAIDPLADPNPGNGLGLVNPLLLAASEYRVKKNSDFNWYAYVQYSILKNLTFKSTFGLDYNVGRDLQFSDTLTPYSVIQGAKKPIAQLDTLTKKSVTNSNVLTYAVNDFKGKHNFSVLIGEETYDLQTTLTNQLFKSFPTYTPHEAAFTQPTLGASFSGYPKLKKNRETTLSFFGRINYAYRDRYLFSFNLRADGSSKFITGKKWGYFPSGSFAWRVKKEAFMENVEFINDLKFRVGYGVVGNNRIPDYRYQTSFNLNSFFYGINNQVIPAYSSAALANPILKWESTETRNLGMDISFFKRRFDLSVDYYINNSRDLLLDVPIASTYGYLTQIRNIGKTTNKGIDIQLNAVIIRNKNFSWTANFNISHNENNVTGLGVKQNAFFPAASWGVSGQPADYITRIGDPVGSIWGLVADGFYKVSDFDYNATTSVYRLKAGVVNDSAIIGPVGPGSIKFKDLNNDGYVDLTNDRKVIGNPTPKFTGGLNQQFRYKKWDMSVFVNFSYGNDVYNANKIEFTNGYINNSNMLNIMAGRWKVVTPTGQTAQWVNGNNVLGIPPDQLAALNAGATIWQPLKSAGAFYPSSWAIENGSFLRINNVTLGYTFHPMHYEWFKVSSLRVYFTANNLAIFTKYTGYDPEVSVASSPLTPGLDYSAFPKNRSFIFGVNASF